MRSQCYGGLAYGGLNSQRRPCACPHFGLKGQLISKRHFVFFNSSKKRTKNFCPSRLGPGLARVKNLNFQARFLEELKTPERHYEIN